MGPRLSGLRLSVSLARRERASAGRSFGGVEVAHSQGLEETRRSWRFAPALWNALPSRPALFFLVWPRARMSLDLARSARSRSAPPCGVFPYVEGGPVLRWPRKHFRTRRRLRWPRSRGDGQALRFLEAAVSFPGEAVGCIAAVPSTLRGLSSIAERLPPVALLCCSATWISRSRFRACRDAVASAGVAIASHHPRRREPHDRRAHGAPVESRVALHLEDPPPCGRGGCQGAPSSKTRGETFSEPRRLGCLGSAGARTPSRVAVDEAAGHVAGRRCPRAWIRRGSGLPRLWPQSLRGSPRGPRSIGSLEVDSCSPLFRSASAYVGSAGAARRSGAAVGASPLDPLPQRRSICR